MGNDIIAIATTTMNNEEVNAVDARELHRALKSKQEFTHWIKNRIKHCGFREGVDFVQFHNFVESYSRARIDYTLSIDAAKHIAMLLRLTTPSPSLRDPSNTEHSRKELMKWT